MYKVSQVTSRYRNNIKSTHPTCIIYLYIYMYNYLYVGYLNEIRDKKYLPQVWSLFSFFIVYQIKSRGIKILSILKLETRPSFHRFVFSVDSFRTVNYFFFHSLNNNCVHYLCQCSQGINYYNIMLLSEYWFSRRLTDCITIILYSINEDTDLHYYNTF